MKAYQVELRPLHGNRWITAMSGNNMEQHRESGKNNRSLLSEVEMSSIVKAGGGIYVGVMNEIRGKMESIVLFISPQTRSTLGLPSSRLSVEAVREQLAESDATFSVADSK
jgi:hypothetical protein